MAKLVQQAKMAPVSKPQTAAFPVGVAYHRRVKHWRDRWVDGAPLIWNKPMMIGTARVVAGTSVTDAQRKLLGRHRVKRWWKAGFVVNAQSASAHATVPARTEPVPASG